MKQDNWGYRWNRLFWVVLTVCWGALLVLNIMRGEIGLATYYGAGFIFLLINTIYQLMLEIAERLEK